MHHDLAAVHVVAGVLGAIAAVADEDVCAWLEPEEPRGDDQIAPESVFLEEGEKPGRKFVHGVHSSTTARNTANSKEGEGGILHAVRTHPCP